MALIDFKNKIKNDMKPVKIKHLSKGSKTGNTLLTRVRLDRSDLNLHKYSIGLSDSPECICHAKQESSFHFIMDCFLYTSERQTLYSLVEQYIPNFDKFNKRKKYEVLIIGIHTENPDYEYTNTNITFAVQNFIFKTKRFSEQN